MWIFLSPTGFCAAGKRCCSRSAGACPPRFSDLGEKRPQPRDHGRFLSRSTHGEGQALALR